MPGLRSLLVSLSEILESQGRPCKELEIWALLCRCAETLQDLIIKGEAISSSGIKYMLTPNNLLVKDNGSVTIGAAPESFQGSVYMAPEFESFSLQNLSETAFEKMFVYSLGRTLQVASEFGLTQNEIIVLVSGFRDVVEWRQDDHRSFMIVLNISYDLDSLLQTMTERNATVRIGLVHILEACALQSTQHSTQPSPSHTLSHLYKIVLDSEYKIFSWDSSYGSDYSDHNEIYKRPGRMRRPRPQVRHRRSLRHSVTSRSRSRSGSHSPSQSRSQESGRRMTERPRIAAMLPATSILVSNSLNRSISSSASEQPGSFPKNRITEIPSSSASHSVQGLLGLRHGSPAFQKYIHLKERQIRLQQARNGKSQSALENANNRLMSNELMDKTSETVSMTSLMSYTLGSYMPYLNNQPETEAPVMDGNDYETDVESMLDSQGSLVQGKGDKEGINRASTEHEVSDVNTFSMSVQAFDPARTDISKEESQKPFESTEKTSSKVELKPRQRQYRGPEFVHKASKPAIKVAMPFQNNAKNVTHFRPVTVVHLTRQKFEITLDPGTTGRQLLDVLISCTDLDDFLFFGLSYLSDGEHFFLDDDTKLHKIAPKGWKEGSKSPYSFVSFTLFVRVKFYPESLKDFRHKSSIHLLYLQLRHDIAEERIKCEDAVLFKLAGMALQVEYGDYDQLSCGQTYFQAEQYVPKAAIRKLGSSFIFKRITEEHEACFGVQSSDAEIDFIKLVRQLPEYGIHFYKLFKSKSLMTKFVWVGLSQHNLVLSDFDDSKRTMVQAYPWNRIMKISFNKRRFSIQPNVEVAKGKPPKLNYYTDSHRKGRYMLRFSTDQHRFQIQMRTRPHNIETLAGDMRSDCEPLSVDACVGFGNSVYATASTMEDPSQQALPHDEEDDEEEEFEEQNYMPVLDKLPHPYQSPPPYQPPSLVDILVDPLILPSMNEIALDAHVANSKNTAWNSPEMHEVLEMSFGSTSLDSALNSERTAQKEVTLLKPSQMSFMHPPSGRQVFKVILEREEKFGIGLTIVGGETTNSLDLGIFIKSVAPGGPAARDGRVKPGDRLIAIDGLSLEGKQHHEAVALFRDAGPRVELLISQIRPPGTLRKDEMRSTMLERSSKNDSLLQETDRMEPENLSHCENQTSFQYDDMLKEPHHVDLRSSDAYISDEDNHLITCPSTPPPPALPSQPPPSSILNFPDGYQESFYCQTDAIKSSVHDFCEGGISSSKFFSLKSEVYEKDHEILDHALSELRADHELSYLLSSEWSNYNEDQSTWRVHQGSLTEEEKKDIQILGDIAALDVEASSSDSDFDTAVKNTLEGSGMNKHSKTSSDTFSIKAFKNPTRNNTNDVIYEVILERQNGPYGIVIQAFEHPKDFVKNILIHEILQGSPAHLGGILAPGDKILEIQGQSTTNMSPEEANAVLENAKDFCVVKISRAAYTDTKLTHQPGMKHQFKNDSGLDSYHFVEHAGSLSYEWKPENMSAEQIKSSSSIPRSHLIASYPKETAKPLEKELNIVPPPPALNLDVKDSESNTQSDVDSDVLDSSQSDLEDIDSGHFFGDEPNPSPRAGWNDNDTETQSDEMNSASLKQPSCKIETIMAIEPEENNKYFAVSPKGSSVTVIPDETFLVGKEDFTCRTDVLHSCNSSLRNITDTLDEIDTNPTKSANKDEFSLKEKAIDFQDLETADEKDERMAVDKNENDKIKDINETVDRLPGGGLHEANEDVSQDDFQSESENKRKDLEEDGNKKSEDSRYQNYNPELVEATLIREPGGSFGFTIAGDLTTGGCYIKHLVSSPLVQYGTVIPGDKLLMVNSDDTTTLSHIEAVSLLRNGPDEVKLKLLRYPSSMQTQENLLMLKNLTLKKGEDDSDLVSNVSSALDSHSVHDLIKSPEKETDAAIFEPYEYEQTRDKAFASESIIKRSMSLSEQDIAHGTVEVHHEMKVGPSLKSHVREREEKLWTENIPVERIEIKIDLRKPAHLGSNLGISLVDREIDGQNVIVVKRLKPDGIAHTDGRLLPGDRLLQANSIPLVMLKAQEAVEILRKAKDRVLLTVSRLKDRTHSIGHDHDTNQDTQNTNRFKENSGHVDSPKDCHSTGAPESASLSEGYTSCRILQVNLPMIMSNEWLADLPLMSLRKLETKKSSYATSILQSLVEMVERGEPAEEFRNIRQIKADDMCSVAQLPENKLKNRFRNILPYDSNRVKLMNTEEGDYINASHISVSLANDNDTLRYIVCQGPLEETMNDFWRMLWQERVNVIAMMTQAVERDKIKCHVYWPQSKGESLMFVESGLQVKLIMSYALENFDVIQLAAEEIQTGEERKLIILQYTSWQDQGAPDTALPILQLLQVLHLLENGRPPLIHCSAGVGRTGVVIAIDIALACIEKGVKFDLYQIVRNLRCQRQGMIQTTEQYTFCYTACMEAILSNEMQGT